jgi:hypothetical protein
MEMNTAGIHQLRHVEWPVRVRGMVHHLNTSNAEWYIIIGQGRAGSVQVSLASISSRVKFITDSSLAPNTYNRSHQHTITSNLESASEFRHQPTTTTAKTHTHTPLK